MALLQGLPGGDAGRWTVLQAQDGRVLGGLANAPPRRRAAPRALRRRDLGRARPRSAHMLQRRPGRVLGRALPRLVRVPGRLPGGQDRDERQEGQHPREAEAGALVAPLFLQLGKRRPQPQEGPRGRSARCGNGLFAQGVRLRSKINQKMS